MKKLNLVSIIAFALLPVPAHATDLTGEVLAMACEGNMPGKESKKTEEYAKFCIAYINGWDDARFAFLKGTSPNNS